MCQIPRSVHARAFAISRWTTSVVDRQACLAGRLEMENVACRRRYTTVSLLVGLAVDAAIRLATTGTHLNKA